MITILNIGDELCYGKTVNTNASFMASQLFEAGYEVTRIVTIRDSKEQIAKSIDEELSHSDIIIMTGGLGPTKDDITKHVIANYFGVELIVNEEVLNTVAQFFEKRKLPLTEINRKQAEVPQGCIVLPNANGTAPGMWMEQKGKLLVALPGVPFEMKPLLTDLVIPKLKEVFPAPLVQIHQEIATSGIGESFLSDKIEEWETGLPPHFKLAYLPSFGSVLLRITAKGENREELEKEMGERIAVLQPLIADYIVSLDNSSMMEIIRELLIAAKAKLAVAESCTGGHIAHTITSLPGASEFFEGGMIAYSNTVKREILNVRELNLKKHGAVSEMVVNDMAINTLGLFDVEYSISTSGVAGPSGGTDEKPVGFCWVAVASPTRIVSKALNVGASGGREVIIKKVTHAALNMLRLELLKDVRPAKKKK